MSTPLLHRFLQGTWLMLPIIVAGLIHIAVIKLDWFRALARCPLDGRRTFRGRRLFGDNKTLRGALVMTGASALAALLLCHATDSFAAAPAVSPLQVGQPALWGFLLGAGYIAGELPNSLIKRQLGIAPGAAASGGPKALCWLFDQLDSVAGALLALSIIWRPDAVLVAIVAGLALLLHPLMAAFMVVLGLKERIG